MKSTHSNAERKRKEKKYILKKKKAPTFSSSPDALEALSGGWVCMYDSDLFPSFPWVEMALLLSTERISLHFSLFPMSAMGGGSRPHESARVKAS